jgi:hypothetical protein
MASAQSGLGVIPVGHRFRVIYEPGDLELGRVAQRSRRDPREVGAQARGRFGVGEHQRERASDLRVGQRRLPAAHEHRFDLPRLEVHGRDRPAIRVVVVQGDLGAAPVGLRERTFASRWRSTDNTSMRSGASGGRPVRRRISASDEARAAARAWSRSSASSAR